MEMSRIVDGKKKKTEEKDGTEIDNRREDDVFLPPVPIPVRYAEIQTMDHERECCKYDLLRDIHIR